MLGCFARVAYFGDSCPAYHKFLSCMLDENTTPSRQAPKPSERVALFSCQHFSALVYASLRELHDEL